MKIGIIGSGMIGGSTARLFTRAGHEVAVSNSRGPGSLRSLVEELGPRARAATAEDAMMFADVVLLAVPLKEYSKLPRRVLAGKIVIDAMNYYPDRDGRFERLDSGEISSSAMVAEHLDGARVVKAFNTIYFEHLMAQGRPDAPVAERRAIFLAGDDEEAKRLVAGLIEEIGFGPVDTGSLAGSRRQEPGAEIYNRELTVAEAAPMLR